MVCQGYFVSFSDISQTSVKFSEAASKHNVFMDHFSFPDRTDVERAEHRQIVLQIKERTVAEPI